MQSQATQMAQAKLSEVIAGSLPLSSQSGTIDEDPEWQWSIDAEQADLTALWNVKVRVWRQLDEHEVESTLSQMVLDPTYRGSIFDQITVTGSTDTAPTSSGNGNNNGSASQGSAGGQSGQSGMGGPNGKNKPTTTPGKPMTPQNQPKGPPQ